MECSLTAPLTLTTPLALAPCVTCVKSRQRHVNPPCSFHLAPPNNLQIEQQSAGILDLLLDALQECNSLAPVDDAVVVR